MDVETIEQLPPPPCLPRRRIPVPSPECLGLLAGLAAAYVTARTVFGDDGEAGGLFLCFMAPFLAVAGVCLGKAAKTHGWARVRPAVWAFLLAVAFDPFRPAGWLLGGAAGGAFNGLRRRSQADTLRGALLGAALGLAGWGAVWGYFLSLLAVVGLLSR
ncbi:MAG TPA: hypothetical protein VKD72_06565 [Gemmataceae bacterium]|nr:hypothetical protein [Gemmataceae bacterium]